MMKIVLVDDRKEVVQGILASVDWAGRDMEAHGFYNGADALAFCVEQSVDLVITDIRMPFMTGLELAAALQARGSSARVILLTGYEDFEYAREGLRLGAVEYLTKPVSMEKIGEVLDREYAIYCERQKKQQAHAESWRRYRRSLAPMRRQWAENLLQVPPYTRETLSNTFDELSIALPPERLTVAMVELAFERGSEPSDSADLKLDRYAVENMGCELFESVYPCACIDLGGFRLAFIINYPKEERPLAVYYRISETLKALGDKCVSILHVDLAGGIGSCAERAESLQKSWQDALRALDQRFFDGQARLVSVLEVPEDTGRWEQNYPYSLQDETVQLLRRRDLTQARQVISDLFTRLSAMTDAPPVSLREHLLSFLLRIFHECGLGQYLHVADAIEQFERARTLREIQDWFLQLSNYLREQTEETSALVANGVSKVKRYIDAHYAEPITLKAMATLAYLSPAYLSVSFKEVLGINFNDYLTSVRMERAKELLSSRQYRVYEVCEMVGYRDKKYFSDLFKKYTGVFPKEWR